MGTTPEAMLTVRIVKGLQKRYGADIFLFKVHGGPMQRAGIPDITGCYMGWSIWFEVKTQTGKPSALQEHTIRLIQRAGGIAGVVYCEQDCVKLLKKATQ